MDDDERQRKLQAGRAKLASFRQKRAKGDGTGAPKKTQKRKGPTVPQNDGATQGRHVESNVSSANDNGPDKETNHEGPQKQQPKDPPPTVEQSLSPLNDFREGELAALTGKEQLKLQQAVEKRNEIIARLSSNLQEALASRDQVQLEAQSLTGQIQALQRQLQQTSVEFLRIKNQSAAEVLHAPQQQRHGHCSQDADSHHKEAQMEETECAGPGFQSSVEGLGKEGETSPVILKLRAELEEERQKSQRLYAELVEEMEKHQLVLSSLEKEKEDREDEQKERLTQLHNLQAQLSSVQSQCLEMQQYKEEKEKLNREVLELRKKLQEEDDHAERRSLEEVQKLKEELEGVRQLLEEREKELKFREEEVTGLKASKDRQNQAKACLSCEEKITVDETNLESAPVGDHMVVSLPGDILMERYLASAPPGLSQSSMLIESFEHCGQLDLSAEYSFELNSEVLGDEPLLSISNRFPEEGVNLDDDSTQPRSPGIPEHFTSRSPSQWLHDDSSGELETSKLSEQQFEETDLEKELLNQQCGELREELILKERDLSVLKEEVLNSAEELEEARSRWAQVTEDLKQALWELEEEKDKRRRAEEEITLTAHQNHPKNQFGALTEGEKENAVVLIGKDAAYTSLLVPSTSPSDGEDKLVGGPENELEKEAALPSYQKPQELNLSSLQEMKPPAISAKQSSELHHDNQLQTLQAQLEILQSELEKTKTEHETILALLDERTMKLDETLKELETTRAQFVNIGTEVESSREELEKSRGLLDSALKEKDELEAQIFCLRLSLGSLEEAQAQAAREGEEHRRNKEEMDDRIKKMEQVLEEELEQFENMLKAKDVEFGEEKEKWEEERQEKEKELLDVKQHLEEHRREMEEQVKALVEKQLEAVEEATKRLKTSHQQEIKDMMEKHQQQISEANNHLQSELQKRQATMEEEQKRQISLIKQVTEREHERMISELTAQHDEELDHLRLEVSLELRESMEAAHQAELQQSLVQKVQELQALRLSLTGTSQLEQESLLTEVHTSLKETFAQESELLKTRHQLELDQITQQNQEQQERLRVLHQQDMNELKQQWETRIAQESAAMQEQQTKEIQALRSQWDKEAESTQSTLKTSLSDTQRSLAAAQAELAGAHESLTQTNKALTEAQTASSQTQSELRESWARLQELQASSQESNQKLEEELKQAWGDRDAAARALEELTSSHKTVLKEREQQLLHLEEKKQQLHLEVLRLQEERTSLKERSEQEVGQLWSQLESMRTSRQELGELKEQLLARSSRVEDFERLKIEFNEQKREIKEQNEAELESLRRYFEQRLRASEDSYREEIALLQLRLVESALEESVLKTADDSFISQGQVEEEKDQHYDTSLELEKHEEPLDCLRRQLVEEHAMALANLQSSMALSFKEELRQVRSDLTDQYYEELQEKRTRHALELEQMRAKLSDRHLQELTRVSLEAEQQVEAEVEQRIWCHTEELQTRMTMIHSLEERVSTLSKQHDAEMQRNTQKLKEEFAGELVQLEEALKQETVHVQDEMKRLREELQERHEAELAAVKSNLGREVEKERSRLEKALHEETEKLNFLQSALDNDESPQVLMVRQRLKAEYDCELQREKSCMATEIQELTALLREQGEERLRQAQERFQEEKATLEYNLAEKSEISLAQLQNKHQTELEHERAALLSKHSEEKDTLNAKHKAQQDSLSASHSEQLAAATVELESKHKAELVALEAALRSKRKDDLESLEAVLQETHQAQLEALEAELTRKHQEERDELEKRMLGNMDTLEATYLKEVQTLRDEMMQLEDKHCQDLNLQKSQHQQIMERHNTEQLSIREDLRKELAQVHIEKFRAMAAELSHVHKTELAAQQEALDIEHCKALETLKKQVLELEQQHSTALQELSHTYTAEKEQLIAQQQELRAVSARELVACRRELEEESLRQRQHFLEEAELLKVQSEERMQDRINQLKTEFEEQKEAELEDLKQSFTSEQEAKEQSYTGKMSQLTIQLQLLDAVVAQLRGEVGCLQGELEGKRSEMETLDTLLQRRERENHEGGNLLNMLTEDLQTAKEERRKLQQANEKLRKVLIEMIRCTITTEDMIGQKISGKTQTSGQATLQRSSAGNKDAQESGISVADMSSEDMELTQLLCESLLVSDCQINPGGEEAALNACSRLRHTVETLLELLNHANTQLVQTHDVHLSLEEKFSQGRDDSAQLIEQHKHLLEQLDREAELKSKLQLELHKAEGLLDGYVAEKAVLEESLQQKEVQEERLVEELEDLKVKLHQMQALPTELDNLRLKHQELSEEHTLLLRQKEYLSSGLGEREKALLAETQRLTQDRLDLQRQAEKDRSSLSLRLRALERELEEQETKGLETEQHHRVNEEDLHQRVQALEKQLKHDRQFIEEQAVEREHERDEFQQEIRSLEAQLRHTGSGDHKGHRVESLQAIIKDKTDDHSSLLAANQQAQRDLKERNEEIDKLAGRIRELEQALLNTVESHRSIGHLEQELQRARAREQELTQDKQALEQQQLSNRLQISALQSKVDETRHCYHDNTRDPTQELSDALDAAQQSLQSKEQEVEALHRQLETVQRDLSLKEVELKHLALQLELLTNQSATQVNELQGQIATLQENVSALSILKEEQEEQSEVEDTEEESLSSALFQEKNQEIDQLNAQIQKLEHKLENTRDNKALEAELEDLHSQVEHLRSEIVRVRQDKREEEERLHEVISTLQAELATLGPNLHEVSDSQDGDSINPSLAPSPEPDHDAMQEQAKRGEPNSLKQELGLGHSASSRSHRSRLKALQSQLEAALAEKDGLERLLLTQEEDYRGHGEEFAKRLTAERERADELQHALAVKVAELKEVLTQKEEETENSGRGPSEEERDCGKSQVQEMSALHEKNVHLGLLVVELQKKEQASRTEIEILKSKRQEMQTENEVLQETCLTLERQVQEVRAEVVDMEELVAVERTKLKTLQTLREELSAEREARRTREGQLQEESESLRQEVTSMSACIRDLTGRLNEKESSQEEAQKEVLTLAKVDAALRQRETELVRLKAEHQALRAELTAVKKGLSTSSEKAEKPHEEGQTEGRALFILDTDDQRLKAELRGLQEHLAVQEEELSHQQRELRQLRHHWEDTLDHQEAYLPKDISHRAFEDVVSESRDEASLSSPEVLRRLECSAHRIPERFHASALDSRLSELSGLNITGLDLHHVKTSPGVVMEPPHSRTITPEPATQSTHSPGSVSVCDHLSTLDSLGTDKAHELEELDLTAPPSPLGSTSSLSAPEWASDGYGSNVSSELGARLKVELEQTERLDAQFLEYLHCRGMNPTVNTDSAAGSMSYSDDLLSPELQGLLKKVYQESCQILTLSQRRATSSTRPHVSDLRAVSLSQRGQYSEDGAVTPDQRDHQSSNPPMSWQQEKRALQETVIALRELLCRMAQSQTRTDYREEDQHRDQLHTDKPGETQLRTELKESQKHSTCVRDVQQDQKKQMQSLRMAVEKAEEALRHELLRVQELQQQLEQERTLSVRKDREEEERRAAVQVSFEQKRFEITALKGQVEQERVACSNLQRELQIEQSRSVLLEKRLDDTQKELQDERQLSARQKELSLQDQTRLERLVTEAESCQAEIRSKLSNARNKLDEERDQCSKQVDEVSRRHEADAARDRKFLSDMRAQLEQERRQGEELVVELDKLRSELLQSRRKWEEEDRTRRAELQREQEAATRCRVALEALKEQKRETSCALEMERERSRHQGGELAELKERMRLLKDKEREREEQREREKRKERQEQMERGRRQDRTNNKLCELKLLRQQDQQRMQKLQHTLAELESEEREMAAQRLSAQTTGQQHRAASSQNLQSDFQADVVQLNQQMFATQSSPSLLERLLKENSDLTERVTSLSRDRATLKHTLACSERQLRCTENELAKVATGTENRPINDVTSSSKVQRLYERYLRAESFRKALVYQKRYLLLLLGSFQESEQATLCLIAHMGARPSPPLSHNRPLGRFRAAVRVVIAISRMRFLTRKWQKAIRRLSVSGTVNGHAQGPKAEVLTQLHPRLKFDSPPIRDGSAVHRDKVSALVPPTKSPFRLHNRVNSSTTAGSEHSGGTSQDPERSLTEYIHHLEKVQQRLVGTRRGKPCLAPPPKEERRIQSACSPHMIGYRQRWLQENRTWLYLSCLSPLYLNGPGSSSFQPDPSSSDH
uniref:Pericentrin/AKAP-450 centrosomal targeting domain-containing protein n=1 Tax=Gasterosteus aculeatus aculeatus TaxID=481459 RepID=A0AAQ4QNG3_GASAC